VISSREWFKRKRNRLKRIERDKRIGYFDEKIDELVNHINRLPDYSTTSSCSGRIIFYDSDAPWGFDHGDVLAKTHDLVAEEYLRQILQKEAKRILWASAQGPIVHVACRDISSANWLNKMARRVGFKHGGVISLEEEVVVELRAVDRVDIPLKRGDIVIVNDLKIVAEILNSVLIKGWNIMSRFCDILAKIDEYEYLREK